MAIKESAECKNHNSVSSNNKIMYVGPSHFVESIF